MRESFSNMPPKGLIANARLLLSKLVLLGEELLQPSLRDGRAVLCHRLFPVVHQLCHSTQ